MYTNSPSNLLRSNNRHTDPTSKKGRQCGGSDSSVSGRSSVRLISQLHHSWALSTHYTACSAPLASQTLTQVDVDHGVAAMTVVSATQLLAPDPDTAEGRQRSGRGGDGGDGTGTGADTSVSLMISRLPHSQPPSTHCTLPAPHTLTQVEAGDGVAETAALSKVPAVTAAVSRPACVC